MKILSLHEIEHTHGTVHLIHEGGELQHKKGTSIILIPQPNAHDPNDPLNWSLTRRIAALYSVLFLSALCNFCITGIAPGFGQLAEEFEASISKITWLIAACLLGEFMGCYTIAPLAIRYGKRPLWIGCALIFFVCNIWAAVAKSYTSLLLARFFASWAAGTSEPLSINTLNDIFFLHERGTQSGVQAIWLSLGSSLAPVVCGFLIQAKGWRWFHWLVSILGGVDLILIFFLVPETQYQRDLHKSIDVVGIEGNENDGIHVEESDHPKSDPNHIEKYQTGQSAAPSVVPKKPYLQLLKPWSEVQKDASLLGSFLRPWAVWRYASVVWAIFSFSIHICCVVVLIDLIPVYMGAPPYNFSISQQGLVFLAPCIGNMFGSFFCGYINDKLSHWSARNNDGIFEPEMRLPVIIFPAILVPIGLLMFGIGVAKQVHWAVPVIGDGLIAVALTGIGSVIQPYLMDSYLPVIMDCLVAFNGFKNLISFVVGFAVVPWLERDGIIAVFCILAGLVFVIDAAAIFIYIYGKRLRQRDARLKIFIF